MAVGDVLNGKLMYAAGKVGIKQLVMQAIKYLKFSKAKQICRRNKQNKISKSKFWNKIALNKRKWLRWSVHIHQPMHTIGLQIVHRF